MTAMEQPGTNGMANEKLINLNKLELGLGIIVACISIASAAGVYVILPYKVAEQKEKIAIMQQQIDDIKKENQSQRDLLIRIDERLQLLQKTLDRKTTQ